MENLDDAVSRFRIRGTVESIEPLGSGLINDTYMVKTCENYTPDYVLQRINTSVFTDVETLQKNIDIVTGHIRDKLQVAGTPDLERHVLTLVDTWDGNTFCRIGDECWRMTLYIKDSHTYDIVNPEYSYAAGRAFGEFQSMLSDLKAPLEETIPNFHNMEYRLWQLRQALDEDRVARAEKVAYYTDQIMQCADSMCRAEKLHREGKLPKRICHCDTKVNNVLFDDDGNVLCVIDLDTVMPNFVFSDYGDFLRTAANTGAEDDENLDNVNFNMDIFKAFTKGYIESAWSFLLPVEIENLPFAAQLFPYMQSVRFLTDYINGDTYYSIKYPEHNFVRARAQFKLFQSAFNQRNEMATYISFL